MTRERMYGSDTEFCDWLRACKELPSFGRDFGLSASDNDVTLHRYMEAVDGVGTREVQAIMQVEVKTRRGKPATAQMDTLSKLNLFRGNRKTHQGHIRFFGVYILVLSGLSPDDSDRMFWGSIPESRVVTDASKIRWRVINRAELISLLRFERHPSTFEKKPFRRHHKTNTIMQVVRSPLGFDYEKPITHRS